MKETTIQIDGKDVVIRKIPLKKYAELIAAFQELPKYFSELKGKSTGEIMLMLPMLIGNCWPDVARVLHVATDLPVDEIDTLGGDDGLKIVEALMETNDFVYIYNTIKKMGAHRITGEVVAETLPEASPEPSA